MLRHSFGAFHAFFQRCPALKSMNARTRQRWCLRLNLILSRHKRWSLSFYSGVCCYQCAAFATFSKHTPNITLSPGEKTARFHYLMYSEITWQSAIYTFKVDVEWMDEFLHHSADGVWIGLKRQSGSWTWADGSALSTAYWATNHPKDGHDCAKSKSNANHLVWQSVQCSEQLLVACSNPGLLSYGDTGSLWNDRET